TVARAALCQRLRASARRFTRPAGHNPRRKRTQNWIETGGNVKDNRQSCKVMYPLSEVLLLVVCGTMAACDDYDDIVLWGNRHL
ncbi:transposase family protein, partial [Mesorhizobium sp. M4B.F.Ca.ET.143.01.1.1]